MQSLQLFHGLSVIEAYGHQPWHGARDEQGYKELESMASRGGSC